MRGRESDGVEDVRSSGSNHRDVDSTRHNEMYICLGT
jgi:hypothetical protein